MRNPIARVVTRIRKQVVPDKRKKKMEMEKFDEDFIEHYSSMFTGGVHNAKDGIKKR